MAAPLLATKLYIPPPRSNLVSRPRLLERLNEGLRLGRQLTLISAPAGCGKTTLISEWIRYSTRPVAWLSLDAGDNDPLQFLSYLVAALQQTNRHVGQAVQQVLHSPQSTPTPPMQTLATILINDVAAAGAPVTLVLDDYHVISAPTTHEVLLFLLEHQPSLLHVVISTREDPPLPLPRLRVRGQITELRDHDLRFTAEEAAAFLGQTMGLRLSTEAVLALEARTEGWIAGLQLAALSMQGRADVSGFIAAFTGSNRYVLDYLLEEVLGRQPTEVRQFLLLTSVLDRMTGPLCNALTDRNDGQVMLESLEQANLFIVPLDQDRTWYRYHHLFAEFLRNRLRQAPASSLSHAESTHAMSDLHRRASEWYEQHGLLSEAVEHALDGEDFEHAARLIGRTARRALLRDETGMLLRWLTKLPEAAIRSEPYLCLVHAWALLLGGQLDAAELRVEQAMEAAPVGQDIRGEVAAIRSIIGALRVDIPGAIELAHEALEHLPSDETFLRGLVALNLGLAYDLRGDIAAASQAYSAALAISQATDNDMVTLMAINQMADLKVAQGRLHDAVDLYRQALRASTVGGRQLPLAGTGYGSLALVLYEWNDLDAAIQCLETCIDLGRQWQSDDILASGLVYLALIRQARGNTDEVQKLMRQAEEALQGNIVSPPTVTVARAYQARLWLQQGNLDDAGRWAQQYQASPGSVSGFQRGTEAATLARVLIAQGRPERAIRWLDGLIQSAEATGQTGTLIECLALRAMALSAQDDSGAAIGALVTATTVAEPEDYVRTFVDQGPAMEQLLRNMLDDRAERDCTGSCAPSLDYVERLIAAFSSKTESQRAHEPTTERPPLAQPLVERLSERELEVLRLLADGLSNKEIADRLTVAVGTVKQHLKSIYDKLEVHNRTEAANRARELGLL